MRKLAPARVSYRDDFLISYRVYIMTESFHISLFEGTLHVDKIQVWFKITNITHALPISVWSFHVYMMPLRDFVPEWNSRPGTRTGVNSRRGDSRRHDILWWYHVNKYRAMRGNQSELAPGRKSPRCHVNTPYVARGHRLPLLNNIFFSALMAKLLQPAQFYLTKGSPHGSFHKPRLKIWKNDKAFSPRGLMTVQNLSSKWFQCLQIHTTE